METQTKPTAEQVLVIDDDVELCKLVTRYLTQEGFQIEAVNGGASGAEQALSGQYALVVLDVMMPGVNGFDVLRRIRAESRVPVLMLTAKGDALDRVLGLEMGADDYLPKPFNPQELVARIRAILRRAKPHPAESGHAAASPIIVGDVEMDSGARLVRRGREVLNLTTVEFDLLEVLLHAAGQVVGREKLTRDVLGREFSPFDRSIDTHVCNLRKKIGLLEDGTERIKGVRGIGYLYASPLDRGGGLPSPSGRGLG
jgi:two-component system response regulator CpxR